MRPTVSAWAGRAACRAQAYSSTGGESMMVAPLLALTLASAPAPDSTRRPVRIVRRFEEVVVRAPLHDLRSTETVHLITDEALRRLPVDRLADAIALKAGVVARGEELHVRGGRTGELKPALDGIE